MSEPNRDDDNGAPPGTQDARPDGRRQDEDVPPLPRKRYIALALLVVIGLLGYGAFEHYRTYLQAKETQHEAVDAIPEVRTITVEREDRPVKLTLPGQTEAFYQTTIYPRATGYVAERRVDIGSHVRKGDLLIRIAAPDLDHQLAQAKGQLAQTVAAQAQAHATLNQAKANLALAQVTAQRFEKLTTQGYQTVQANDNQKTAVQSGNANVEAGEAGIKVADANTEAAQATVERLQSLVAFERVDAPYDGIITTRGVEVGNLVNADSATGRPLFTIAYDKVLRVTVHVPQSDAFAIRDGLHATAYLPQKPEQRFSGRIARSSIALLNSARTLDTEADIENPDGALRPGAFVRVSFDVPRLHPTVVLPAEALVFGRHGMQVATVQGDEVHMVPISIDRDFGDTVELRDGLNGGEQIIVNPPPELIEHSRVRAQARAPGDQAAR